MAEAFLSHGPAPIDEKLLSGELRCQSGTKTNGRHPIRGDFQGPVLDIKRRTAEGIWRQRPQDWRGFTRAGRGHLKSLYTALSHGIPTALAGAVATGISDGRKSLGRELPLQCQAAQRGDLDSEGGLQALNVGALGQGRSLQQPQRMEGSFSQGCVQAPRSIEEMALMESTKA